MELKNIPQTLNKQFSIDKTNGATAQATRCWSSADSPLPCYTNRRPYRSVAFGTWKVGNASQLTCRLPRNKQLTHTK
uniref:Uncharacterized protein n=1 Tax=Syphacia muris TaxID=451379 RepID=A0A0N5AB36_9BILA